MHKSKKAAVAAAEAPTSMTDRLIWSEADLLFQEADDRWVLAKRAEEEIAEMAFQRKTEWRLRTLECSVTFSELEVPLRKARAGLVKAERQLEEVRRRNPKVRWCSHRDCIDSKQTTVTLRGGHVARLELMYVRALGALQKINMEMALWTRDSEIADLKLRLAAAQSDTHLHGQKRQKI